MKGLCFFAQGNEKFGLRASLAVIETELSGPDEAIITPIVLRRWWGDFSWRPDWSRALFARRTPLGQRHPRNRVG
jgi:hypothetical protein